MIVRACGEDAATSSPSVRDESGARETFGSRLLTPGTRLFELLLSARCRREAGDPAVNQQVQGRGVAGVGVPLGPRPAGAKSPVFVGRRAALPEATAAAAARRV